MPFSTIFFVFSSENSGFCLIQVRFAIGEIHRDAIIGSGSGHGDIPLAYIFEHFLRRALQRIS
jgi:hypothetical protein